MKKRLIYIISVVVLLAVALFFILTSGNSTLKDADFTIEDTASITKIVISGPNLSADDNSIVLERGETSWILNDDFTPTSDLHQALLTTLKEQKVKRPANNSETDPLLISMQSQYIKVEVWQEVYRINMFNRIKLFKHNKKTKSFFVGHDAKDNIGTFMLKEGSKNPHLVYIPGFNGFLSTRYTNKFDDWRNRSLLNVYLTQIDYVENVFPSYPGNSFRLTNLDDRQFELFDIDNNAMVNEYDEVEMLNFISSFNHLAVEAYLDAPQEYKDSVLATEPLLEQTLVLKDGVSVFIKYYKKEVDEEERYFADGTQMDLDPDRLYAFINGDADMVLIQYFVFDPILRNLRQLKGEEDLSPVNYVLEEEITE